jgi:hypothetical protein
MRRWIVVAAMLAALTGTGLKAARNTPAIATPICRFLHFYQEAENESAPMRLWERVVYSLILTEAN